MASAEPPPPVRSYPFSEANALNLDPTYAYLRQYEPVARVRMPFGGEAWLLTRYTDVKMVLGDPRLSRAASTGCDVARLTEQPHQPGLLITMDAPNHARLRRLTGKAFTRREVAALQPRVVELTHRLLGEMIDHGAPADLVQLLALPLSIAVMCELFGIPSEDREIIHTFAQTLMSVTVCSPDEVRQAQDNFCAYISQLVGQRRENPTDDLLSAMVHARDADDQLSEPDLMQFVGTILVAGYDTTASQLANSTYLLLRNRERFEMLVADPTLVPSAVEELLRFVPLSSEAQAAGVAMEDIEISGTCIRTGESVIVSIAAANRDGDVISNPNELNLARKVNPHLAFGHGSHFCIGAHLARLELQTVLRGLVERLPSLRFGVPEAELKWSLGRVLRQMEALPVAW
jgi:cytochrome P450